MLCSGGEYALYFAVVARRSYPDSASHRPAFPLVLLLVEGKSGKEATNLVRIIRLPSESAEATRADRRRYLYGADEASPPADHG